MMLKAETEVRNLEYPFLSANFTIGEQEIQFNSDLGVDEFESPVLDSYLKKEDGVIFTSRNGSLQLKGTWDAVYNNPFGLPFNETTEGWSHVSVKDIDVDISAKLTAVDYHPHVVLGDCKANLGTFDYVLSDGYFPGIANMFRDLTSTDVAEFTAGAKLGYGSNSCENSKEIATLENFPEEGLKPKMVVVWLGESLSNCLLKSVHDAQLIQIPINKDSIPDYRSYLRIK
ncbi:unnamed protein product [Strongylus vulgaris]|uniref:Uncharacterized protein n=1 Tax=Strongylus vulgaris TaxID=40348 RepID=A0A3P7M0H1_STRVU|nr:unnamed protein product [Strongylus vulgaris]